jgi:hypothetical protein
MREDARMVRGLMLAVVLGFITFVLGWSSLYETRSPGQLAIEASLLARPGVSNGSVTRRAGAAKASAAVGELGRAQPMVVPSVVPVVLLPVLKHAAIGSPADRPPARTGPLAARPEHPQVWSDCNHSYLRRHYAAELAAEAVSPAALRTTRVLPTIFVPCCPKAGTTFLNQCVSRAFHPSVVCNNSDPASWVGPECAGRSFVLGGVRTNPTGFFHEVKEPFYFNKEADLRVQGAARDLANLAGPPLPLCTWSLERMGAPLHAYPYGRSRKATRAFWDAIWARPRVPCRLSATPPPAGTPLLQGNGYFDPKAWPGCRTIALDPPIVGRSGFVDTVAFKSAYPLAAELPAIARTYDMTPNYLCSTKALSMIRSRYGPALARRARFVVMLRDPVARAFSEFSMFRTWGWEKVADFGQLVEREVLELRRCLRNDTLLTRPVALAHMRPAEVVQHVMKCGSGEARQYVRNSMYETCIAGAYAHFERSQFMFLFAEDLRDMSGGALLEALAAFTGLTLRRDALGAPSAGLAGHCDTRTATGGGKSLPNHQTKGQIDPELKARLRRFFAPSRAALAALIEGSFQAERPLARLRALAAADPEAAASLDGVRDLGEFGITVALPLRKRVEPSRREEPSRVL